VTPSTRKQHSRLHCEETGALGWFRAQPRRLRSCRLAAHRLAAVRADHGRPMTGPDRAGGAEPLGLDVVGSVERECVVVVIVCAVQRISVTPAPGCADSSMNRSCVPPVAIRAVHNCCASGRQPKALAVASSREDGEGTRPRVGRRAARAAQTARAPPAGGTGASRRRLPATARSRSTAARPASRGPSPSPSAATARCGPPTRRSPSGCCSVPPAVWHAVHVGHRPHR
jgi:hypothetical protein